MEKCFRLCLQTPRKCRIFYALMFGIPNSCFGHKPLFTRHIMLRTNRFFTTGKTSGPLHNRAAVNKARERPTPLSHFLYLCDFLAIMLWNLYRYSRSRPQTGTILLVGWRAEATAPDMVRCERIAFPKHALSMVPFRSRRESIKIRSFRLSSHSGTSRDRRSSAATCSLFPSKIPCYLLNQFICRPNAAPCLNFG